MTKIPLIDGMHHCQKREFEIVSSAVVDECRHGVGSVLCGLSFWFKVVFMLVPVLGFFLRLSGVVAWYDTCVRARDGLTGDANMFGVGHE